MITCNFCTVSYWSIRSLWTNKSGTAWQAAVFQNSAIRGRSSPALVQGRSVSGSGSGTHHLILVWPKLQVWYPTGRWRRQLCATFSCGCSQRTWLSRQFPGRHILQPDLREVTAAPAASVGLVRPNMPGGFRGSHHNNSNSHGQGQQRHHATGGFKGVRGTTMVPPPALDVPMPCPSGGYMHKVPFPSSLPLFSLKSFLRCSTSFETKVKAA